MLTAMPCGCIIVTEIERRNGNMTYYEIYFFKGRYEIWKCFNNGVHHGMTLFKVFKTRKGAENWAKKCWDQVTWR